MFGMSMPSHNVIYRKPSLYISVNAIETMKLLIAMWTANGFKLMYLAKIGLQFVILCLPFNKLTLELELIPSYSIKYGKYTT